MNKKLWVVLVVVAVVAVVLVGQNWGKPQEAGAVKIGGLLPLTGKFSALGEDMRNALEMAKGDILEKHGLKFNFVYEDSGADPKIAVPAVNKLISVDGVHVIIAGPGSSANLAVAPIVEENKVIFAAVSATPKLNTAGEYVFKLHPDINGEVSRITKFIYGKGLRKIGLIYDSASDSQTVGKDDFLKDFTSLGGKVVVAEGYDSKTVTDFRTVFAKMKSAKVDSIYILAVEKVAGTAVKQAREIGLAQPIFGWSPFDSAEFIRGAGSTADGVIITAQPFSCSGSEQMRNYCTEYKARFGDIKPLQYGAHAYDFATIIAQIIKKHSFSEGAIKQELLGVRGYQGVSGDITLDQEGNVRDKDFEFRVFKNGQFEKYDLIEK